MSIEKLKAIQVEQALHGYALLAEPVDADIVPYTECGHTVNGLVPTRLNEKGLELVANSEVTDEVTSEVINSPKLVSDLPMPEPKSKRYRSKNIAWGSLSVGNALFFDAAYDRKQLSIMVSNRNKRGAEKYFVQYDAEYNGVAGSFVWRSE